jgi:hypothetical protein
MMFQKPEWMSDREYELEVRSIRRHRAFMAMMILSIIFNAAAIVLTIARMLR